MTKLRGSTNMSSASSSPSAMLKCRPRPRRQGVPLFGSVAAGVLFSANQHPIGRVLSSVIVSAGSMSSVSAAKDEKASEGQKPSGSAAGAASASSGSEEKKKKTRKKKSKEKVKDKKESSTTTTPSSTDTASSTPSAPEEEEPREPSPYMLQLTTDTFDNIVYGDLKQVSTFVKFYAPWCGHCKALRPAWDKLAEVWHSDGSVQIADVNCEENGELCYRFRVSGYPTLRYFTDETGEEGEVYEYQREEFFLKKWVATRLAKKCGPHTQAGCSPEELKMLRRFVGTTRAERQRALGDAQAVIEDPTVSIVDVARATKKKALLEQLLNAKKAADGVDDDDDDGALQRNLKANKAKAQDKKEGFQTLPRKK
ncbi:unnamed protein product [Amoebophrya sp. A120]|nr:unnamed protein product [Amoebophrya sp. A120]|eukprot:GSA120T00011633001.1